MKIGMNGSPRVFWTGMVLALLAALAIWMATGTGWGAAVVMGYVRVMFMPYQFRTTATKSEVAQQEKT